MRMVFAVVFTGAILWAAWPRKASLRSFDPDRMARVEALSWRHYYEKRCLSLGWDLYQGARNEYGLSPGESCLVAVHAARAAKAFQPTHSRNEAARAMPMLEDYFAVIHDGTGAAFDVKTAAKLELEWWELRREDKGWQDYGRAIAAGTAVLYNLPATHLEKGCLKRAEMMDLRDRRGKAIKDEDWRVIEAGLREAWASIKEAVSGTGG